MASAALRSAPGDPRALPPSDGDHEVALSIVVPVLNEQDNVIPLVAAIDASLVEIGHSYEVIVVDDGSTDQTYPRLESCAAQDGRIRLVKLRRNYGQPAALAAGFDHARGDAIVTLDGDLQNDPADIGLLLDKIDEGYDVVSGWRQDRQDSFGRRLPSRVANWLIGLVTGVRRHDYGCTLKAYRAEIAEETCLCGFADDLLVPAMDSVRPLSTVGGDVRRLPAWLPSSPVDGVDRFALGPSPAGPVESPWYALARDAQIGVFISGPRGSPNALSLEWGEKRQGAIESAGRDAIGTADGPHDERAVPWRFVLASELPRAPPGADAVRVVLANRISRGSAVGVSAPVTYASEALTKRLGNRTSASLIHPIVLPHFPCARQPTIRGGVAETPDQIITQSDTHPVLMVGEVSPFSGLLDMYMLQWLALADSEHPPDGSIVFGVDQRIPGAIEAPPDSATAAS